MAGAVQLQDVHRPALPPGYEAAIEHCNIVGTGSGDRATPTWPAQPQQQQQHRDSIITTRGQTSAESTDVSFSDNEPRGQQAGSKPPGIIVSSDETEEDRSYGVLRESRWLMEDNLSVDGAESLLRACGSDGSFIITNTEFPSMYTLFCRRVTGDATVDSVEQSRIEKTPTGSFIWEGQGEFQTLAAIAARFLHINPHKHCPMFANRRVWSSFSAMFVGDEDQGFALRPDRSQDEELNVILHNTINQNDWFFPALSEEQAAYMLNQHGKSNCFIISNQALTENYILSTRQPIAGLDQDIIEHLRVAKLMDNVYQLAGDDTFHQSLDAVVAAYRHLNPAMKPLFERTGEGSVDRVSSFPEDEQVAPPEYNEASVLPNPDELNRLPTVARIPIVDSDVDACSDGEEGHANGRSQEPPHPRRQEPGATAFERCCIIL